MSLYRSSLDFSKRDKLMIMLVYFAAGILLAIGLNIAGLDSNKHFKGAFFGWEYFDPTLILAIVSALIPIGLVIKYKNYISDKLMSNNAINTNPTQSDYLIVAICALLGFLLGNYFFIARV